MRAFKLACGLLLLWGGLLLLSLNLQPEASAGPCLVTAGPIALKEVFEASGLAVSRRHRDVLWSHNDSGNPELLFAFDRRGTPRGRVRVPVRMRDWEDISAARCPDGDCLYFADIGDNRSSRPDVSIYRVIEPALDAKETAPPQRFRARYADGAHNAEAMFVIDSTVFIITRDRTGALYRSPIPGDSGISMTLQRLGTLGLSGVTDAEASTDGRTVAVRTERNVLLYRSADLIEGRAAPYFRLRIDGLREAQGEGVALDGNELFLASEGGLWSRAGSLLALRCAQSALADEHAGAADSHTRHVAPQHIQLDVNAARAAHLDALRADDRSRFVRRDEPVLQEITPERTAR